jgi:exonuclease III
MEHYSNQNFTLNIFHQNVCGLLRKTNELLLSLSHDYPHVICISEHHLNQFQFRCINMENYVLAASYSRRHSMKGGTCIYTHKGMCFEEMNIINSLCLDFNIEACVVKLHFNNCKIYILSIYRTPISNLIQFLHKFDITLNSLVNLINEIMICGDFNIYFLNCARYNY